MMDEAPTRRRTAAAFGLSLALIALGVTGVLLAGRRTPLSPYMPLPWPVLVASYVAATQMSLGFQRRDSTVAVTLVQLPLALGVVLVAPVLHLACRITAALGIAAYRRHGWLKTTFNVGLAAMEVGVVAFAVSHAGELHAPSRLLWGLLLLGLLTAEVLTFASMSLLFIVLGLPVSRRDAVEPLVLAVLTSAVFDGLAVLTISATWTDESTIFVVLALAVGLGVAYRGHRRVQSQQEATERLYAFVKGLGPVDVQDPEALTVLEVVRELLHAEHLELSYTDTVGKHGNVLGVHLRAAPEVRQGLATPPAITPNLRRDWMTTPLFVGESINGLLTARTRIGTDRGFDLRDLRLLETVANELSTALDRGRMMRELARAARTDFLTDLPNLHHTTFLLDELLRQQRSVVVAALSVDSYREVNDTLGHQAGDQLLREVARRLQETTPGAIIGRTGGGRFAVVSEVERTNEDAALFGLALQSRVEGGAKLDAFTTHVRLSVGCARGPEHGADGATLLRRADVAMHSARSSQSGLVLWEAAYELQAQRRLTVVSALREALDEGAIGVAFQPKFSALTNDISGVEALARWEHIALGEVQPDEFVPLAQAAGLMSSLTRTVLQQACQACETWQSSGRRVPVAVNVSARTLEDPNFIHEVGDILSASRLNAELLTLELTESVVLADPDLAQERMKELKRLGVKLSVDDFGTGYSSLTYLKRLPIDEVKIDRGFVSGVVHDVSDQAVIRAVVDIAHTLQVTVVAEGVERQDQHVLLRELGVDEVQGYLHGGPAVASDLAAWLECAQWPGPNKPASWPRAARGD